MRAVKRYRLHFSRGNLPIECAGDGDALLHLAGGALAESLLLLAEHLQRSGDHGLAAYFRQLANVKYQRIRNPSQSSQSQFPLPGFGIRSNRDLNIYDTGQRDTGRAIYRFAETFFDSCNQVGAIRDAACGICRGFVRLRTRGHHLHFSHHRRLGARLCRGGIRSRTLESPQLFAQQRGFLVPQYAVVFHDFPAYARTGDEDLVDLVQPLSAQFNLESSALLAARRINESNVRPRLRQKLPEQRPARSSTPAHISSRKILVCAFDEVRVRFDKSPSEVHGHCAFDSTT